MLKPAEMKKRVLALLRKEGGRLLNKSEISRALELPGSQRKGLREVIAAMVESGQIEQGKKGRYAVSGTSSGQQKKGGRSKSGRGELVGKLKVNAGGHGWFYVNKTDEGNIATGLDFEEQDRFYVSPRAMDIALDGDIVRVKTVKNDGGSREHNDLRARVVEVVER